MYIQALQLPTTWETATRMNQKTLAFRNVGFWLEIFTQLTLLHTTGIESIAPITAEVNHRAAMAPPPYKTREPVSSVSSCKKERVLD